MAQSRLGMRGGLTASGLALFVSRALSFCVPRSVFSPFSSLPLLSLPLPLSLSISLSFSFSVYLFFFFPRISPLPFPPPSFSLFLSFSAVSPIRPCPPVVTDSRVAGPSEASDRSPGGGGAATDFCVQETKFFQGNQLFFLSFFL